MEANELFEDTMDWLKERYHYFRFYTERDLVWTVQSQLFHSIESRKTPFRVFNDFPIMPGNRRALTTDIAILREDTVEVAVEFKCEPAQCRSSNQDGDIWHSKIKEQVVSWNKQKNGSSVEQDLQRIDRYTKEGKAKSAYFVLIDEGARHTWRGNLPGSQWLDWGEGRWVLWSKVP